jgi:PKD repeat protein
MSAHVSWGRSPVRLVLVTALVAALATVLPATAHAASGTSDTWHMDETSGSTMTDSTGNHPGKLHNVALGQTVGAGVDGTGYGFNGRSSYVNIPNSSDLNAGSSDVHISFHLMTTTVPSKPDYDLFRKGQAPGQEYKVEMQPNGQVSCYFHGSAGSATVQAGPDLHDGLWHSIQCEKSSSAVTLTIDGKSYSSKHSVGAIGNSFDMIVGAYPGGDFYKGEMDELTFAVGSGPSAPPTASFTATPTSGKAPLKVSFKDTSTNSPSKWQWDFGDGSTATSSNPSHTFDKPGTYTVSLTVSNAAGSDISTTVITAKDPDDKPPSGSFTVAPGTGWAKLSSVTLTQTSIGDNVTPPGSVRRAVDWKDGKGPVAWATGTTTTHVYGAAGSFTPTVTLTDLAGNSATVSTTPVTISADTAAPVVAVQRPGHRSSATAWRVLKGHATDGAGTGLATVRVRAIERRGAVWYAYRARTHSWVRAGSRAAALRKTGAGRAVIAGSTQWSYRLPGVRRGSLVVRLVARDKVGNTSRVLSYSQLLTHG